MNKNTTLTASTVINTYPIDELTELFKEYGEIKNASKLAEIIGKCRRERRINTTQELVNIIENGECVNEKHRNKYLSQVFQTLRIEVNSELENLKTVLSYIPDLLSDDGRLVVLSYHSLEDTIVKSFVKTGNFDGELIKDYFGNIIRPLDPINNKPIMATHEECVINNRARSAKMRVAQKKLC
jgi:16S rRNA (cytosine1402-N4)-methyltransferase